MSARRRRPKHRTAKKARNTRGKVISARETRGTSQTCPGGQQRFRTWLAKGGPRAQKLALGEQSRVGPELRHADDAGLYVRAQRRDLEKDLKDGLLHVRNTTVPDPIAPGRCTPGSLSLRQPDPISMITKPPNCENHLICRAVSKCAETIF